MTTLMVGKHRAGRHWLTAVALSAAATVLVGFPLLISGLYDVSISALLLFVHFVVMTLPIAHILSLYAKHKDYLHPSVVAGITFVVFHLLLNPLIISNRDIMNMQRLNSLNISTILETSLYTYVVLFVAWCSYVVGRSLFFPEKSRPLSPQNLPLKTTPLYFGVGILFVGIGIWGNIGALGGLDSYLSKMLYFYERPPSYLEIQVPTMFVIFQKFLPVGLFVLAYGYFLHSPGSKTKLFLILLLASVANVFLSSATGSRGIMFTTFFYAIILWGCFFGKFTVKSIGIVAVFIITLALGMGNLREAAFWEKTVQLTVQRSLLDSLPNFAALYLTNYPGTLILVSEVERSGIIYGATAFAGLTGLFGGPNPITTQAEIWYRLIGVYAVGNPRYGPPGELFFNFGWIGLIVGMVLIGILIKALSRAYKSAAQKQTLASGLIVVFAVFTAYFVMIADLSYIPPYFLLYSFPFYFVFIVFRDIKC